MTWSDKMKENKDVVKNVTANHKKPLYANKKTTKWFIFL